ncbi:MAG: SDR family NAD(P)-dependent oxidoreductase [Usitatibacteraceae bacterium]
MLNHSVFPADSVVLITGAASGIGRATAELFLRRGARIVAVDLKWNQQAIDALSSALVIRADVSSEDDCIATVAQVNETFDSLDVLVNCAGITRRASVVQTTAQEWDNVINVNLRSVYLMSRQALKLMLPKKKGSIVNIASGWGLVGGGRAAAYCASKGGVVLLTKAMAIDHGPDGIRINCVCPGDTDTPMLRFEAQELGFSADALLNAAHSRPLGRAGHPDEIAEAVVFLASPAASFMTGAAMIVDGGSLAGSA